MVVVVGEGQVNLGVWPSAASHGQSLQSFVGRSIFMMNHESSGCDCDCRHLRTRMRSTAELQDLLQEVSVVLLTSVEAGSRLEEAHGA